MDDLRLLGVSVYEEGILVIPNLLIYIFIFLVTVPIVHKLVIF